MIMIFTDFTGILVQTWPSKSDKIDRPNFKKILVKRPVLCTGGYESKLIIGVFLDADSESGITPHDVG